MGRPNFCGLQSADEKDGHTSGCAAVAVHCGAGPTSLGLQDLPSDVRRHLLRFCDLASLLPLSAVCREFRDELSRDELWSAVMHIHLANVAASFFGGALPPPPDGRSWKQHAISLLGEGKGSWLNLAREHSGRKLVRLHVRVIGSPTEELWLMPYCVAFATAHVRGQRQPTDSQG